MVNKYTATAKWLHWIIALAVILLIAGGYTIEDLPEIEKPGIAAIHSGVGLSVLLLMLFRLYWRRGHPPPPLQDTLPPWQVNASLWVHRLFYVLILLQPVLGLGLAYTSGYTVAPFGLFNVTNPGGNEALNQIFHILHGTNGSLVALLVIMHAGAALWHQFVQRDGVLWRMLWRA